MSRGAIILWSVPRARSTAFERMMHERGDHDVAHEPFSRVCDFGEASVANVVCRSQADVITAIDEAARRRSLFVKDTLDFAFDVVLRHEGFLRRHRHAVMVRDPAEAVRSHLRLDPTADLAAMGFHRLAELADRIEQVTGTYPHVVSSQALIQDPAATVQLFCRAMGIDHRAEALTFRRPAPSSWQRTGRWHIVAAEATGIGTPTDSTSVDDGAPPAVLESFVAACRLPYDRVMARVDENDSRGG